MDPLVSIEIELIKTNIIDFIKHISFMLNIRKMNPSRSIRILVDLLGSNLTFTHNRIHPKPSDSIPTDPDTSDPIRINLIY